MSGLDGRCVRMCVRVRARCTPDTSPTGACNGKTRGQNLVRVNAEHDIEQGVDRSDFSARLGFPPFLQRAQC